MPTTFGAGLLLAGALGDVLEAGLAGAFAVGFAGFLWGDAFGVIAFNALARVASN